MGGASGSAIVGALLAARFNAGLHAAGMTTNVDLGMLRRGAEGMGFGPAGLDQACDALISGFQLAFAVCAALMVIALVIAAGMRDVELRSSQPPNPAGH